MCTGSRAGRFETIFLCVPSLWGPGDAGLGNLCGGVVCQALTDLFNEMTMHLGGFTDGGKPAAQVRWQEFAEAFWDNACSGESESTKEKKADIYVLPTGIQPTSGPENRLPGRKLYCITFRPVKPIFGTVLKPNKSVAWLWAVAKSEKLNQATLRDAIMILGPKSGFRI